MEEFFKISVFESDKETIIQVLEKEKNAGREFYGSEWVNEEDKLITEIIVKIIAWLDSAMTL